MLLTRLCLVLYATPRMLKLLLFCLWPSRIVVPFDRSILIVLKIGLFVNCVSAKPAQTLFLGQRLVGPTAATNATDTATSSATTTATRAVPVKPVKPLRKAKKEKTLKTITVDDRVPQGTLPSRRVAGFKDLWSPAFLLLFVIVFNACHVHL